MQKSGGNIGFFFIENRSIFMQNCYINVAEIRRKHWFFLCVSLKMRSFFRQNCSCREALGRQRSVSLRQSCVLKRGCALICFSCLSKQNFGELGKAESSKELFLCIQCWISNWSRTLYAALETWETRELEEETAMHEVAVRMYDTMYGTRLEGAVSVLALLT